MTKRDPNTLEKLKYLGDFVSDGCSSAPDLVFYDCCEKHDIDYATNVPKMKADKDLRLCIKAKGFPFLSWVYWLGVNLGGWWGYYFGNSSKRRRIYIDNLEKDHNIS
jgi:hypothetical protein